MLPALLPRPSQRHLGAPQCAVNIDQFQGPTKNNLMDISSGNAWPLSAFLYVEDNFSILLYPFFKNLTHLHRQFREVITAGISKFDGIFLVTNYVWGSCWQAFTPYSSRVCSQ